MSSNYQYWPFDPDKRHHDLEKRWWEECYAPSWACRQLADSRYWTIVTGPPKGGKTITLNAWAEKEAQRFFIVPYQLDLWPGSPSAWFREEPEHLPQMLAACGKKLRYWLEDNPQQAVDLGTMSREFLRWLLDRIGRERGDFRLYRRFVEALPQEYAQGFTEVEAIEDGQFGFALWQMDEMSSLLRELGFQRLVFTIDYPTAGKPEQAEQLIDLFGWLEATNNPRFDVVAAVPETISKNHKHDNDQIWHRIVARARDRVNVIHTRWTEEQCRAIAQRHMLSAIEDTSKDATLQTYASAEVLDQVSALIDSEYVFPSPGAWVDMAETLLFLTYRANPILGKPLTIAQMKDLTANFYDRHMYLRIDPQDRGVWRGPQLIEVRGKPYKFLKILAARGSKAVNWWDDDELHNLVDNSSRVHKIAQLARARIEPVRERKYWVYVMRLAGEDGYKLENCLQ